MPAHKGGVLGTDSGKVELSRNERCQFDHRLIDDDDDEAIDVRRAAQWEWELGILGEHPAAVGLVSDKAKRAVADRSRVPGRRSQLRVGNAVQQVGRQDRKIGEHVGNMLEGWLRSEPYPDG